MHADHALRQFQSGRYRRYRNRRGVGGQYAGVSNHGFQFGKQRTLDGQIFHDGFYHQSRIGHIVQAQGRLYAGDGGRALHCTQTLFQHQLVECCRNVGHGFSYCLGPVIVQAHGVAS